VLITGETGTGGTDCTRHTQVRNVPPSFYQRELRLDSSFAYRLGIVWPREGSFHRRFATAQGRFELAHSGTIFLMKSANFPRKLRSHCSECSKSANLNAWRYPRHSHGCSNHRRYEPRFICSDRCGSLPNRSLLQVKRLPDPCAASPGTERDIPMLVEYFARRYAEKAGKQISKIDKIP